MASFQGKKINPKHFHISQLKFYIILLPFAVFMVLPIIYIFTTAFKPADELFKFPPSFIVKNPTWDNYKALFELMAGSSVPASRYLFNSVIVTVLTVVISIFLAVSAGYVLSKQKLIVRDQHFGVDVCAYRSVDTAFHHHRQSGIGG